MSQDNQKTYDAQTAHFLGVIAQNIPALPADIMQHWTERPKRLQQMLELALNCYPQDNLWTPMGKGKEPVADGADYVPLPVNSMRCTGENPFAVWKTMAQLQFGVEYNPLDETGRHELILRPYLYFEFDEDTSRWLQLQAKDVFRGGQKLDIKLANVMSLLERTERDGLSTLISFEETSYINQVVAFIRDDLETRLSCLEKREGWEITLTLLKGGASYYITTFWLGGVDFRRRLMEKKMKVPSYVEAHII